MVQLKVNGTECREGNVAESVTKTMQTQQVEGRRLTSCSTTILLSNEVQEVNGTNNGESTTMLIKKNINGKNY